VRTAQVLRFFAFFRRTLPDAFPAFLAISFRCSELRRLALAYAPLRPISERYLETWSWSSIPSGMLAGTSVTNLAAKIIDKRDGQVHYYSDIETGCASASNTRPALTTITLREATMASLILVQELSADLGRLEAQLSQSKTSVKSLLILREPTLVLAALSDLTDAMRAIQEESLRAIVRINLTLKNLKGGRA
jgi:hypothetical protein